MSANSLLQGLLFLLVIMLLVRPLGWYIAQVYERPTAWMKRFGGPIENFFLQRCGINPANEMGWKKYLIAVLCFNLIGILVTYGVARLQSYFPVNPTAVRATSPDLAFNMAISFASNTDWQAYVPERSVSYLTQMLVLTVQNFLSAATGMSVAVALIRGLKRHETSNIGNFWVDMVRSVIYILLPLAVILSVLLVSQGVVQNFSPTQTVECLNTQEAVNTTSACKQAIPMGPVASQVAIKQLGTNGGGFFNANAAHPFENPTPLSNFLELVAILLLPTAFCYAFGVMVNDRRQGWALIIAMTCLLLPMYVASFYAEQYDSPIFSSLSAHRPAGVAAGANMEGKEVRFGLIGATLWATSTAASANGSTNAALDSFTPLGGLVPLWLMHLGEVVFGGVGSGLYGLIMYVILTVFVAGLMVGRTPEYLGKKIEPYEMKMASFVILVVPMVVLIATALAVLTHAGQSSVANPLPHGFTEILYAFTSMVNNNGSAFAGLNANTPFYNCLGGLAMLLGRYWILLPVLALAGSLARKKVLPTGTGTLATHTPLFIVLLVAIIIIMSALTFFPALSLGPIAEHFIAWSSHE